MRESPPFSTLRQNWTLVASLLLLLFAVWLEPSGSWLAEPDEARYAEIPREMLSTGDFVTPRLNGVPYFEKPPLLYWSNAVSMSLFGETPWAARLPTRLAGLATTLLLILAVARFWGELEGLVAGLLFLLSPLAFTFSRLNLTDGLLTFFFTGTLFAAWATLRRAETGRPHRALSAVTGALAAGAFLAKGLIGIVLPGGILLLWCLITGRSSQLESLLWGPALPVFLLFSAPWFWLVERRHPGFLHFFFIHEHFQRFATPIASRPGPIYYFLVVFLAGFLPGLAFFFSGLRPLGRKEPVALFFVLWFTVVLLFFSLSHSKLSPYLFPAFPPAAALAARGLRRSSSMRWRPWLVEALLGTLLVAGALGLPVVRSWVTTYRLTPLALFGGISLLAGGWASVLLWRRTSHALGALAIGWCGLYVALALMWPSTPQARDIPKLAETARLVAAGRPGARIISYRTYLQGFPWELKSVLPLADHTSELEYWFLPESERQKIFWSREKFWQEWVAGRPLVVLARIRDRGDFLAAAPAATLLESRGKHCLLANFEITR